jgi:hypothetical protein
MGMTGQTSTDGAISEGTRPASSSERGRRRAYKAAHLLMFALHDRAMIEALRQQGAAAVQGDTVTAANWRSIVVAVAVLERINGGAA